MWCAPPFPPGPCRARPRSGPWRSSRSWSRPGASLYGGAVGYLSYSGNADLAIAIRTLVTKGETIHVQAGAGIVADSIPDREHKECVNKARAVVQAVEMARRSRGGS